MKLSALLLLVSLQGEPSAPSPAVERGLRIHVPGCPCPEVIESARGAGLAGPPLTLRHGGRYTDATLQTIAAVSNVTDTLIVP